MMDAFSNMHPALQALIGGLISWRITALGTAIEFSEENGQTAWLPSVIAGLHRATCACQADKRRRTIHTDLKKTTRLFLAITLHNILEGLAIGVVFGAAALDMNGATVAAMALAFGGGIQNIPEDAAVSVPL